MMSKTVYLVGDKFDAFANNENILSIAALSDKYNAQPSYMQELECVACQGIDYKAFHLKLSNFKNSAVMNMKEDKEKVHKQHEKNVMITIPQKKDDKLFTSNLALDHACVELSDHVSGQHISGMILIEAARQMMLATTERYFLPKNLQTNSYFVLNNIDVEFFNFLFPLEVEIKCRIVNVEIGKKGPVKAEFAIEFYQYNALCSKISIKFSVYDKSFLDKKETSVASEIVARLNG